MAAAQVPPAQDNELSLSERKNYSYQQLSLTAAAQEPPTHLSFLVVENSWPLTDPKT